MAEAPAPSPTAPASDGETTSLPAAAEAPRGLPPTLLIPPPPTSGRSRAARDDRAAGRGGRRKGGADRDGEAGRALGDQLVEAVRVVGRDVDAGVAGADILELAMAKGPMFSWLSYWPEEGYPKEDHPY
ncbi:uncharacterized protein LOC133907120 [Phragmites australis]|uniref:uncharacterized protein LOC133907120 n=1 Tax=Phragmites australis TaxID=29695 RepID=UPI002D768F17|nr:uncharacterized protein LOC133907120 [Phragmites australis]XP_062205132.1 uncharacterized protein LOC133907120 [Phragmites australis]